MPGRHRICLRNLFCGLEKNAIATVPIMSRITRAVAVHKKVKLLGTRQILSGLADMQFFFP